MRKNIRINSLLLLRRAVKRNAEHARRPRHQARLQVIIYDQLGRAHLALHDAAGVTVGRGKLSVPARRVRRLARGAVRPIDKPRNLKRSFIRGSKIFRVTGGKRGKVELMYVLTRSARIRKDVQFSEDFRAVMLRELDQTFAASLARAMATRRK